MLRVKLPHLRGIVDGYVERAAAYSEALAEASVRTPAVRPGQVHTFRNYVVHLAERESGARPARRGRDRDRAALRAAAPPPARLP